MYQSYGRDSRGVRLRVEWVARIGAQVIASGCRDNKRDQADFIEQGAEHIFLRVFPGSRFVTPSWGL